MTNYKRLGIYAAAALVTAAGIATGLVAGTASPPHALRASASSHARLTGSTCTGPVGTAYIALPGYQAFDGINTADCSYVQNYNIDDPSQTFSIGTTGGYSDGTNYEGSDPGVALSGHDLWFAISATDSVAVVDTTKLTEANYNPSYTLIPVGLDPQQLAATPDGSQVWVADTGPQTSTTHVYGIDIISTATDKVVDHLKLSQDPTDIAFSPDGTRAYVTTSSGLEVLDVASHRVVGDVAGLGSPQSVVASPDGDYVYVTETSLGKLATISTRTDRVARTTKVGDEPWQVIVGSGGSELYVANPDSDSVSVIDASTGAVKNSLTVPLDPDAIAVTPDGSELWVASADSGDLYVVDSSDGSILSQINLGYEGPNSGDGMDPSGIVLSGSTISGAS